MIGYHSKTAGFKSQESLEKKNKLDSYYALRAEGCCAKTALTALGISKSTYYRWKKKYGGMGTEQLKELKRLQKENERLRRAVSDLTLDKLILREAASGNF